MAFLREYKYASKSNCLKGCHQIPLAKRNHQKTAIITGAATPGFNSLIPEPSVPSLVGTEPVQLFCRPSNTSLGILSASSDKNKNGRSFLAIFIYNMRSSAQRAQNENSKVLKAAT